MASNGSTSVQVTAYDTLKFNWVQVGQSTVNNYTTINWSLQLISGSAGQIISSVTKDWSVTINGTTYVGTSSVAIGNNTTKTLASGQVTISHDSDGSKSFSYSFSQEFSITFAGISITTKTGSGTGTLNTIPRATQPSLNVPSIDMGGTVTIYTLGASGLFTHDLSYSFAGGTYQNIQTGVTTSVDWKVPTDLAYNIPNTTSGTVTIKCVTKNGTTVIGTKTVLLTVKVPTTVVPTVLSVTHTEANDTLGTSYDTYIQGKSKIKTTITASGAQGSTIKSYSSTFAGKTYAGKEWTSDTVMQSGSSLSIVTTVTDTRGRTATKTTSVSVSAYALPKITTFHVARYNSKGEADPDGTMVKVRIAYSVTSLNNDNTARAVIQYKKNVDSAWSTLTTKYDKSLDTTITSPSNLVFETDYQYDFKLSLTDNFNTGSPVTYTTFIPSGAVILDIRADGKGIAFFKTSTKEGVDIAGALPDSAIPLTTNADLDDLTTPGFYVIPTTAISSTINNRPYSDNATASIKVERTGDGMVKQILQKSTKDKGVIYERGNDSSGWGAWSIVYAGAGKILWSGNNVMDGSQTVTLSESVSQQQHGIVLVFSRYATSGVQNYAYSCHFVSKLFVSTAGGTSGVNMNLLIATTKFDYVTGKTLTITDKSITGHADNTAKGTTSGITYSNDKFALRYVIGV